MSTLAIVFSLSMMIACVFRPESGQALPSDPPRSENEQRDQNSGLLTPTGNRKEGSELGRNIWTESSSRVQDSSSNGQGQRIQATGSDSVSLNVFSNGRYSPSRSGSSPSVSYQDRKNPLLRSESSSSSDSLNWRDSSSRSGSLSSGSNRISGSNTPESGHSRDASRSSSYAGSEYEWDSLNWRDSASRSGSLSSGSNRISGSNTPESGHSRDASRSSSYEGSEHECDSTNWRDSSTRSLTDGSGKYRSIILAQSWAPGTILRLKSQGRKTFTPTPTQWTIHGLWLSWICSTGFTFNGKDLKGAIILLMDELTRTWPSLDNKYTNEEFWEYEYRKHATDASDIASINGPYNYFHQTIQLFEKYNMERIFKRLCIFPDARINSKDLRAKIRRILGVDVQLMCEKDDNSGYQYIFEARICFKVNFELTDCVSKNDQKVCDDRRDAIYLLKDKIPDKTVIPRKLALSEVVSCSEDVMGEVASNLLDFPVIPLRA